MTDLPVTDEEWDAWYENAPPALKGVISAFNDLAEQLKRKHGQSSPESQE